MGNVVCFLLTGSEGDEWAWVIGAQSWGTDWGQETEVWEGWRSLTNQLHRGGSCEKALRQTETCTNTHTHTHTHTHAQIPSLTHTHTHTHTQTPTPHTDPHTHTHTCDVRQLFMWPRQVCCGQGPALIILQWLLAE